MLDLSRVPVVDSNVTIRSYMSINGERCIKLEDTFSSSILYLLESKFNRCFKVLKNILENEGEYGEYFARARGHKWFRLRDIDCSLSGGDYFMVDRVPIYVEMFKHISKYKVCLDRDSLLSQNLYVLETVNKRMKNRKKLSKANGLPYLNL
jgi:hypothetical protein